VQKNINLPGYNFFGKNSITRAGGMGIYVKNSITRAGGMGIYVVDFMK